MFTHTHTDNMYLFPKLHWDTNVSGPTLTLPALKDNNILFKYRKVIKSNQLHYLNKVIDIVTLLITF